MELENHIEAFFETVRKLGSAAGDPSFVFAAIKKNGEFEITQGRILIGTVRPFAPFGSFETDYVKAGHFKLEDVHFSVEEFVAALRNGGCPTPSGPVFFRGNEIGKFGGHYEPFHPDGIAGNERIGVLTLYGGPLNLQARIRELDWSLKGAAEPFDSLQELYNRFRIGPVRFDTATIEVVALNVLSIDLSTIITETECEIAVKMSSLGDVRLVSVGYRVVIGNEVSRARIGASGFQWCEDEPGIVRGSAMITVPNAAVVQAFATYGGIVTHQGWIADPTIAQNPRRATYEAFDRELSSLTEIINKPGGKGNVRDLEAGVAWLLWMLGFSPAHLGMIARLQEAPDILAVTPSGNFVVVECTTGPLKTDNKLPLLLERSEAVRERLAASGNVHSRLIPAIVTSKRRIEIRADLEQAERLGVLVITSETLHGALPRTLTRGDADRLFVEGEEAIAKAQSKHIASSELQLQSFK